MRFLSDYNIKLLYRIGAHYFNYRTPWSSSLLSFFAFRYSENQFSGRGKTIHVYVESLLNLPYSIHINAATMPHFPLRPFSSPYSATYVQESSHHSTLHHASANHRIDDSINCDLSCNKDGSETKMRLVIILNWICFDVCRFLFVRNLEKSTHQQSSYMYKRIRNYTDNKDVIGFVLSHVWDSGLDDWIYCLF
jgi:hypothetical protein